MSTMVSRPILKNIYTFAYKFYNIELGVANYTGVASHVWLTIRWLTGDGHDEIIRVHSTVVMLAIIPNFSL